jgi:hypothetical protein
MGFGKSQLNVRHGEKHFSNLPFEHRRNSGAADNDPAAFPRHFDGISEVGA